MDNSIKKLFAMAIQDEKNKNIKEAIEKYKTIVKKLPIHFESWLNLGAIYLNLNKTDNALICFESCLKIRKDYRIFYNIGLIHYKSKRFAQAAECFQSCMDLNKNFLPGYLLSAYNFAEEKKYFQAIKTLEEAESNCGHSESLFVCLAISYSLAGDFLRSMEVLDKTLALYPKSKTAKKLKARNIIFKNVTSDSVKIFKEIIKVDPVMQEIDNIINSSQNKEILKNISRKKLDLICKKEKTKEDYLNLSLISFVMGNGNAAMDFLENSVAKK